MRFSEESGLRKWGEDQHVCLLINMSEKLWQRQSGPELRRFYERYTSNFVLRFYLINEISSLG